MADDAYNAVKDDIKAGVHTRYTDAYPIYIVRLDAYEGGNVFLLLRNGFRDPVQTVDGSVLYYKRGCRIEIYATSEDNRDKLFLDIIDILTSTNRGYKIKRAKDVPHHQTLIGLPLEVEMIL